MAKSPSHKFGQIIGDLLESVMEVYLVDIAKEFDLYLDKKRPRSARNGKKEVIWKDIKGNKHKLDFVFERKGSEEIIGDPVAFIEIAWRRYTKHSKNKAQEIQGAITPLIEKYSQFSPFYGAILGGEFTAPSITQLKSHGFKIVYFPYETIINALAEVNIDAYWGEGTDDNDLQLRVEQFDNLSTQEVAEIIDHLLASNKLQLDDFSERLRNSITRQIVKVRIFSLHGIQTEVNSIQQAIDYVTDYDETTTEAPIVKYEIKLVYNNEDVIEASFKERSEALSFLTTFLPV
ncbi:hypothetical protein [Bacillus infantis]|uniref:hypothetical protein n=1 Tax=Bacillus infantis TaxID=324767 RepID=UPI002155CF34|nr:hypothetical protein [Bacillus infantis]MCR6609427.1 hypothetical protein [Bacillus infantis]